MYPIVSTIVKPDPEPEAIPAELATDAVVVEVELAVLF